jgi:hypothetical protein
MPVIIVDRGACTIIKRRYGLFGFRCARDVKHFSQRAQRLRSGRNVGPDKRRSNHFLKEDGYDPKIDLLNLGMNLSF